MASHSIAALTVAAALALASCQSARAPVPPAPAPAVAGPGVTPSTFRMPEGAGCAGEVTRYRAVLANDLATGHVGKGVHDRVSREVDQAEAACAAGRDAEAVRMIAATKARYGYR